MSNPSIQAVPLVGGISPDEYTYSQIQCIDFIHLKLSRISLIIVISDVKLVFVVIMQKN